MKFAAFAASDGFRNGAAHGRPRRVAEGFQGRYRQNSHRTGLQCSRISTRRNFTPRLPLRDTALARRRLTDRTGISRISPIWPGIQANEVGYQFLNKFNNEVKFGRAYIDRDGDVAIQMDRNSAGGVSSENIESDFDVFLLLIQKFLTDLESQAISISLDPSSHFAPKPRVMLSNHCNFIEQKMP